MPQGAPRSGGSVLTTISGGFSCGHAPASKGAGRATRSGSRPHTYVYASFSCSSARIARAVAPYPSTPIAFECDRLLEQRLDGDARADAVGIRAEICAAEENRVDRLRAARFLGRPAHALSASSLSG